MQPKYGNIKHAGQIVRQWFCAQSPKVTFTLVLSSAFYVCCIYMYSEYFRLDFIMEANNMNPDQTAPLEQSDLGPYYLHKVYLKI